MRGFLAIMSLAFVAGCDVQPTYAPVIVSAADFRKVLPELTGSRVGMVQDEHGQTHRIYGAMKVEYAPEPPVDGVSTNVFSIEQQCLPPTIPHPNCELDKHANAPVLYVESGHTHTPKWDSIESTSAVLLVSGGVIGGEVYCFAECGTGGKIALAAVDVVAGLVAVTLFAIIIVAVGKMD